MKKCQICYRSIAILTCRRCGRSICKRCHYHHGLCIICFKELRNIINE